MGAITLQFVDGGDLSSWAIQTFERGWASHVDTVTDRTIDGLPPGSLLGARTDFGGGVRARPANYTTWKRVERVVIATDDWKVEAYWKFIIAQIGKPYDKLAIAAFAFDRDWRTPDAWFCDELVAASLEAGQVVRRLAGQVNRLNVRDLYLVVSAIAPVYG
jgi:hypothetical protein